MPSRKKALPEPTTLAKPESVWKRPITLKWKELFKPFGKTALSGAGAFITGNPSSWVTAATNASDMLSALGLGQTSDEAAWLLIYRAFVKAILELAKEQAESGRLDELTDKDAVAQLGEKLDRVFSENETVIERNFFLNPKALPLLKPVGEIFAGWLMGFGMKAELARSVAGRLPAYFVYALEDEWRARPGEYQKLKDALDTPFTRASEREREWRRYRAFLSRQVDERLFDEAFSLRQVYVPLRAYWAKPVDETKKERMEQEFDRLGREKKEHKIVVDLMATILNWLEAADKKDAVRVVSGGPGSGKSSFGRILAAQLAEEGRSVIFLQLHWFNPSNDFSDEVGRLLRELGHLGDNPLDSLESGRPLILILDGLDELAMSGKIGSEAAQQFTAEVQKRVEIFNHKETRVLALISGREIAVQSAAGEFKKPGVILHVLPYVVLSDEEQAEFDDSENLLAEDQRNQWWKNYGEATGKEYSTLPKDLGHERLSEITAQPLLNFLVALSRERGKLSFNRETSLNEIYDDLLAAVYERGWEQKRNEYTKGLAFDDFAAILEEIALATWHGNGRTTTISEIESHCRESSMGPLLESFQEGAKKGVTRLLTAFYFRETGERSGSSNEKTFEFTHKSFGEFLTARRIVREMRVINKLRELNKEFPSAGSPEQLLENWGKLCGPTAIDPNTLQFLQDETRGVHSKFPEQVVEWQKTFGELIDYNFRQGMPMDRVAPGKGFHEHLRQARNAEEMLLVAAFACAVNTHCLTEIHPPTPTAVGTWLGRLCEQRESLGEFSPTLKSLGYLNLLDCTLKFRELGMATLHGANLKRANLSKANLFHAALSHTNLSHANLGGADLRTATFEGAKLLAVNFEGAKLLAVNFEGAKLAAVNFDGTTLTGARFRGVDLKGAKLAFRRLNETDFQNANLDEAKLEGASLVEADLKGASLVVADLERADLERANLERANLERANLERANLRGANLRGANLEYANLRGASLERAIWINGRVCGPGSIGKCIETEETEDSPSGHGE